MRVVIVDDEELGREVLRSRLGLVPDIEIIGDACDGPGAVDLITTLRPDLVFLDVRMPGMSGLDLQRRLAEEAVCSPVIIITGFGDVPLAVRAMKNGAIDFIEKPISDQALLDRVQEAVRTDQQRREDERVKRLTPRELEIMKHVVAGKPSRVIAAELQLSPKTIEAHRARLMDKLQANCVADVVRIALLTRVCEHDEKVGNHGLTQ
jgi:FixJ family two-component response regulator